MSLDVLGRRPSLAPSGRPADLGSIARVCVCVTRQLTEEAVPAVYQPVEVGCRWFQA